MPWDPPTVGDLYDAATTIPAVAAAKDKLQADALAGLKQIWRQLRQDKWSMLLMAPMVVSAGASFAGAALSAAAKPLAGMETKDLPGFSGVAELPVPGLKFLWRYDSTLGQVHPRSWGVGFQMDLLKWFGKWDPSPPPRFSYTKGTLDMKYEF
jgi:hypothetical protein